MFSHPSVDIEVQKTKSLLKKIVEEKKEYANELAQLSDSLMTPVAQFVLAREYKKGGFIPVNIDAAITLYEKAAQGGHHGAKAELAFLRIKKAGKTISYELPEDKINGYWLSGLRFSIYKLPDADNPPSAETSAQRLSKSESF